MASSLVKIGTCGFSLSRKQYYSRFSVVEIQQTFYQPPEPRTAERWRRDAPSDFEFAVKAWQLITHEPSSPTYRRLRRPLPGKAEHYGSFRPTPEVAEAWRTTEEVARLLEARVILFQTPASFELTETNRQNMRAFFRQIARGRFLLAWEPRGRWPEQEVEDLCRELDLVHVVDPFQHRQLAGSIRYFRLHGKGGYRYRYSDGDLAWLKEELEPGMITYFLFNNISMAEDAERLKRLVHG